MLNRAIKTRIVTILRFSAINMCKVSRVTEIHVIELSEEESNKIAMDF